VSRMLHLLNSFKCCVIIGGKLQVTLLSCRIMVLDKGRIAEFDEPSKLLADQNSIFCRLAAKHGLIAE